MSEQPQFPWPQEDLVENAAIPSPEPSPEQVSSASLFGNYVDLDSDSSGIFSSSDVEAAKQIIRRM
jgi:hypothetical protein